MSIEKGIVGRRLAQKILTKNSRIPSLGRLFLCLSGISGILEKS
jgi:hypothetical protein